MLVVKVAGDLSVRFGQPSVFGKPLWDWSLAPAFWVDTGFVFTTELAELGVLLLMFIAGVETDVRVYEECRGRSFSGCSRG